MTTTTPERVSTFRALGRRWPTALAVALAALNLLGGSPDDLTGVVGGFGEALLLLPLAYLILTRLGRRGASWPVLGGAIAFMVALRTLDVVEPAAAIVVVALIVLVWGAFDRHPAGRGMFAIQALGMAGFATLALAGLAIDPDAGRYVVAAGWFLHGVWDFVHLKLDKVAARSYAEWCGVFDMLVAAQLIFLL